MYRLPALLILVLLFALPAGADSCLRLAIPSSDGYLKSLKANFEQAMLGSGVCVMVELLPAKRATALMIRGHLDGEVGRIESYGETLGTGALRVKVPLITGKGYLLSRNPQLSTIPRLGDHSLGILTGIRWQALLTGDVRHLTTAPDSQRLVDLLHRGRVDAILVNGLMLARSEFALDSYHRHEVYSASIYLWLNRRHRALAARFEAALIRHIARHGSMQADLSPPNS